MLAAVPPPVAAVRPHPVESPHGTRIDPYYWMRDDSRKDPEVLAHLAAETAFAEAALAPTTALRQALYAEMLARIQEDDTSAPVLDHGYWYASRFTKGSQYPVHVRRRGTIDAPEEVFLDEPALASGHAFFKVASYAISSDGRMLAWTEDAVGRNQFVLRVKDLDTGVVLPDTATDLSGSLAWANDGRTLFYVVRDPVTLRSRRVVRHVLGEPADRDVTIHDEGDASFYTSLSRTKSDRFVAIYLWSTVSTEVHLIEADAPTAPARLFCARERDHEYSLEHLGGRFLVRTNWRAKNFRVVEVADDGEPGDRATWRDLVPARDDVYLGALAAYDGFVAVSERTDGLRKVRVLPHGGAPFFLDADEPTYTMSLIDTPTASATAVRYQYSSLTTPATIFEREVATDERRLIKRDPVLGSFDRADYVTDYVHATATDGTRVPISLVSRRGVDRASAPLLVYGYGSYGASMDPSFSSTRLTLLDRGWVYAIAHVRGGQELGRPWYEAGKLAAKQNTFGDFIAATEHLIATGHGARDQVFAMGGSAGGLLVGAVLNQRPDLYRGALALVPFVDVVTTMLDESIPLTTNEYDEWGDPRERAAYDRMLAYSPYDNVRAAAYPALLVETGLWDSQVQYWEPAKWVARLRATKTDANPVLFHVNLDAGHGGTSGRYQRLHELARHFAFLLDVRATPDPRRAPSS